MKLSKEFVKPFAEMTELDKMENQLGNLEVSNRKQGELLKEFDKTFAEKSAELEALKEERERVAQDSVSTIANMELIRREIERLKSQGSPP